MQEWIGSRSIDGVEDHGMVFGLGCLLSSFHVGIDLIIKYSPRFTLIIWTYTTCCL
jgi:hypothetical protein